MREFKIVLDGSSPVDRKCGDCQLCCKLLPVKEIDKLAGHRCSHQKFGKGCAIYSRRPFSCRGWSCVWYLGADLPRPDHCHYVVDPMPDFCIGNEGNGEFRFDVLQVWLDPKHLDAWRCPKLHKFIEAQNLPALIRLDHQTIHLMIFPPARSRDGKWFYRWPNPHDDIIEKPHTMEEIFS